MEERKEPFVLWYLDGKKTLISWARFNESATLEPSACDTHYLPLDNELKCEDLHLIAQRSGFCGYMGMDSMPG
jgi:hypothetical protein